MSNPAWFEDLLEEVGTERRTGAISRQEAVTKLRDAIDAHAERPFQLAVYADYAGRAFDAWGREHAYAAPAPSISSVQAELFPDLKPRLYIRVGVTKPVMDMTAHDWEAAAGMIRNRTDGAINSAKADWEHFEKAWERVKPHLKGEATTASIARELRGIVPLEGLTA